MHKQTISLSRRLENKWLLEAVEVACFVMAVFESMVLVQWLWRLIDLHAQLPALIVAEGGILVVLTTNSQSKSTSAYSRCWRAYQFYSPTASPLPPARPQVPGSSRETSRRPRTRASPPPPRLAARERFLCDCTRHNHVGTGNVPSG